MSKLIYPFGVLRVFFSLRCNFNCVYCSMRNQEDLYRGDEYALEEVDAEEWNKAFKRIEPTRDLIITPCNAEPPIFNGCANIVNDGLVPFKTYLYTNCSTLSMKEIEKMKKRDNLAFYVSYHRGEIDVDEFIENAKRLQETHNVINFHAPMYPPFKEQILEDAVKMKEAGITLDTTHEYLGVHDGKMHYSYLGGGEWIKKRLAHRLEGTPKRKVLCKTSFNHDSFFTRGYTVAPNGDMYTCWRHLYNKNEDQVIGNFFDEEFQFEDKYYECEDYGDCNICAWHKDIKDAETGEQLDSDVGEKIVKTVSACIITGNEENLIEDCILSIQGWVDEIILVDTGVTDKTIEIAKKAGGDKLKVYKFKWTDDFSAARNFSISKATKDWIFIIDTDERVIPGHGENLKKMLPTIQQDIITVSVVNLYMDKETSKRVPRSVLPMLRFFRTNSNPGYIRAVHNQPKVKEGSVVYRLPFTINHLGYDLSPEKMAEKYERTVRMCRKLTVDNPDDPESWFHLARILRVKDGKLNEEAKDEIMASLDKGLALSNGNNDRQNVTLQIMSLKGWMHHWFQEHRQAIDMAKRALVWKPDYLDAIFLVGMSNTYGVDYVEGERWLKKYLEEQERYDFSSKIDSITMEHANSRVAAYRALAQIEELKQARALNGG